MSRKSWIVLGLVAVLAVAGGAVWYFQNGDADIAPPAVAATGNANAVTAHDMTLGNPKAKLVMIEYAAPICPHCAHFNATVMPLIKKTYIDTGKMLYVFRVFPLHPADGVAEKLARCMDKAKYFPFIDQLFANQKDWDPEYGVQDIRGALLAQAAKQGMTTPQAEACIADPKPDAQINQVAQDAVSQYNIDHTPTVILNGKVQQDATWEALKPAIDKALAP